MLGLRQEADDLLLFLSPPPRPLRACHSSRARPQKRAQPLHLGRSDGDRGKATELTDLAAKQPERVKELAAKWDAWAKRTHVLPAPGVDRVYAPGELVWATRERSNGVCRLDAQTVQSLIDTAARVGLRDFKATRLGG